mgnify:CR=1 FL=1
MEKFMAGTLDAAGRYDALVPESAEASEMLVSVDIVDYSASAVAKAVEDCDVALLGLSVTGMTSPSGRGIVWLRVGARNTHGVERSLARYGYETVFTRNSDNTVVSDTDRDRINQLLRYLEV